jgi:hypothetical protein
MPTQEDAQVAGLFVLGALAFAGLLIFGVLWAALSLVFWLVLLPFKLLGLVFKGMAVIFMLPFLLLLAIGAVLAFGFGLFMFFIPALPLVLVALGVWWLMKRRAPSPHAT